MKHKSLLKTMLLLCALIAGSSSVWADDATITFSSQTSGTSDGSTAYTTSNFVSSGIASSSSAFGTITCSATAKCYSGKTGYGLKAGGSSNAGSFTLAFSTPLTNVTQITLNRTSYASDKTTTITVKNGSTTLGSATTPASTDFSNMDITNLNIASLSGITVETGKYCYIKSITITYSATPTCVTPTFSPGAGTYTSAQNVTISTTTTDATIHYTTDGSVPTTNSPTYSNAISVNTTTTIKAIAVKDGYNNSSIASATYNFVTIEHAGTQADPYTVADARNAIDANTGISNVYVTGIVCTGGSDFGNNALNYWISDDGTQTDKLEAYRGKNLNNTNFSANTDVKVGEIVTIYGSLTKFNTTYEFTSGNYLVDHKKKPATPTFNPDAGVYSSAQNVTLACTTDGATIYYTMGATPADPTSTSTQYSNAIAVNATTTIKAVAIKDGVSSDVATATYTISAEPFMTVSTNSVEATNAGTNGSVTVNYGNLTNITPEVLFYEANGTDAATYDHSWIVTGFDTSNNLEYTISENTVNVDRVAYLKIHATGTEGEAYSELITITQAAAPYASLPFAFDGGSAAITTTVGLTQEGLGGDYGSSPKLKFDSNNDCVILRFNETPGMLSFDIKGNPNSGSWTGTFKVQTSINGSSYSDLAVYTDNLSTSKETKTLSIPENVRYIKWILTDRKANVALGNIILTKGVPVSIGEYEWATFVSDQILDFENTGVNAYAVTGHSSNAITKSDALTKVPANTPLLLNAAEGTYAIPVAASASSVGTNLLKAGTGAEVSAEGNKTKYVLSVKKGNAAFKKINATAATVPTGKAYLEFDEVINAPFLDFYNETTNIDDVRSKMSDVRGEIYNLNGQRVAQPTKGPLHREW